MLDIPTISTNPLTEREIEVLLTELPRMSAKDQEVLLADLETLQRKLQIARGRDDFLAFCQYVYDGFKEGAHHRFLKPILHNVMEGTETRVTVSMAPRFGKSESVAYLFVAWYLGHYPNHHIIMATHTADLSAAFGRKVRNMLENPRYREIFPDSVVARDKSGAAFWATTAGGQYLAVGVGANLAGHGAHLLIADDLVSEKAVLAGNPDDAFSEAFEWLQVGPLQRLMPGGRIIQIGTRWGKKDPIGRSLLWAQNNPDSPQWTEVRFPAILPSGRSLWPEQWPVEQLLAKKASMFPQFWEAQYMQTPTSEEGAIVKRDWWRVWEKDSPPPCEFILHSWDTAHETKTASDPSACMTWGVFFNEEENQQQVILLDAWQKRMEFPALKKRALEYYKEWKPDCCLIEKKAAGAPLIQELRAIGIPVSEFSPSRGNDKRVRLNAVADMFASGMVWAPDMRWAHEVLDQVAEFPNGEHDEYVDCTSQALTRIRNGGLIRLQSDFEEEYDATRRLRKPAYY